MFDYKTIAKPVEEVLIREKGSKFLGYLYPTLDEDDIKKYLDKVKEIHPKATHHCYAYRLGLEGKKYRANDDGEPSGSAGLPIYNQLLGNEITNVLLVVVRYYGGTKLGVSGLVKAYKETAKLSIENAKIITKELEVTIILSFPFDKQNKIFTILNKANAKIIDFDAQKLCNIKAKIKKVQQEEMTNYVNELPFIDYEILD